MDELSRFRKKAASYRKALEQEPAARLLELYPILWYLEKLRELLGKRKRKLRVVDLMSGSGFLSENLFKVGYTDIHSIEFCLEMCQDASAYASQARLHHVTSFEHLEGVLAEIEPDVIISLASFHHLLAYDADDNMDYDRSISMQTDVVDMCMRALPEHGLLIITDLIDEGVAETAHEPFSAPMKKVANQLRTLGVFEDVAKGFDESSTIHVASSKLHRLLGCSRNGSLRWFREIVDKKTLVGHKDVAISSGFLSKVSNYRPIVTKFTCPWIFETKERLVNFVFQKFGFNIENPSNSPMTKEEVFSLAEEHLGIREKSGYACLGWNLGVVLLGRIEPFSSDRRHNTHIAYLSGLAVILCLAIIARYIGGLYVSFSAKDIFWLVLSLPIGAIFGDWFASRRKK
ncbi:MAG TPA: class I SAM-dependent methyltransferase [Gammaproteobacteria bacterium]|nr:class I SAM-dependent methyltransferase [Gammaproteobacteria bacterium]